MLQLPLFSALGCVKPFKRTEQRSMNLTEQNGLIDHTLACKSSEIADRLNNRQQLTQIG